MGSRSVPDHEPGEARGGHGAAGVLTLAGGADRPRGGRPGPAGRRSGERRRYRRRGHPPGAPARRALDVRLTGRVVSYYDVIEARRAAELVASCARAGTCSLSPTRGCPRSAIPATGSSPPPRRPGSGHRGARAVRGDHRARRLRAAHRQVLLRGLPAAQDRASGNGGSPSWRPTPAPRCSSSRRAGSPRPLRSSALARRRPRGGRLPGADQGARGDQARHAGRTRVLGDLQPAHPRERRVRRRPGRNHAGRGRSRPCRRQGRRARRRQAPAAPPVTRPRRLAAPASPAGRAARTRAPPRGGERHRRQHVPVVELRRGGGHHDQRHRAQPGSERVRAAPAASRARSRRARRAGSARTPCPAARSTARRPGCARRTGLPRRSRRCPARNRPWPTSSRRPGPVAALSDW